jgi:hypothetical protein
MTMANENDVITATLIEKEIISVQLTTVDVLQYVEKQITVIPSLLIQEIPTKLSSVRFQTAQSFITGTIKFYLNGLKEYKEDITEISSTIFEIAEAITSEDDFEVEYIKLT